MHSQAKLALFAAAMLLSACGGGGDGGGSATQPPSPTQTSVSGTLTSQDATTLELPGTVIVTFPPGFATTVTPITLAVSSSPEIQRAFTDGTLGLEVAQEEANHLLLKDVSPGSLGTKTFDVLLFIGPDTEAAIAGGQLPAVIFSRLSESADPDEGETLLSYEAIPATYDAQRHALLASVPARAFDAADPTTLQDGDTLQVALKAMAVSAQDSDLQLTGARVPQATLPSAPFCTATWVSPMNEYRAVGAFLESRPKSSRFHYGLDIVTRDPNQGLAQTGHSVRAVGSGYISEVRTDGCCVKPGKPQTACQGVSGKGISTLDTYSLKLTLDEGGSVIYRHILRPSQNVNALPTTGLASEPNIETCFFNANHNKYRVSAGEVIALSGSNGSYPTKTGRVQVRPHLHIEYVPPGNKVSFVNNANRGDRYPSLLLRPSASLATRLQ